MEGRKLVVTSLLAAAGGGMLAMVAAAAGAFRPAGAVAAGMRPLLAPSRLQGLGSLA